MAEFGKKTNADHDFLPPIMWAENNERVTVLSRTDFVFKTCRNLTKTHLFTDRRFCRITNSFRSNEKNNESTKLDFNLQIVTLVFMCQTSRYINTGN